MKKTALITLCFGLVLFLSSVTFAQFVGSNVSGQERTVSQIRDARIGTYVVLTGNIVDHQREEYFTFRDATGTITVEIENRVWQRRDITPETRVRIMGEVDRNRKGRYIWVNSLDIIR